MIQVFDIKELQDMLKQYLEMIANVKKAFDDLKNK
jgi:hypothetical protein